MMRKDIILIASVLLGLVIVLFFMTQNTRFESNLINCKSGQKSFKVTYTELKTDMVVNFQKNDEVETSFAITNLQDDELYFEQQFAKYKLNLSKLTAIETSNGEKLVYMCSLKSFKM
jgi:uncharacterized membrane protein